MNNRLYPTKTFRDGLLYCVATELQGECMPWTARFAASIFLLAIVFPRLAHAQEHPYIVTYDQFLEEPRNLEIEYFSTYSTQRGGNRLIISNISSTGSLGQEIGACPRLSPSFINQLLVRVFLCRSDIVPSDTNTYTSRDGDF
jgi:hypothetical protein